MPSFDAVSEVDLHELSNAVDQANREVGTRYDLKGTDTKIELNERELTLIAEADFQIKQVLDILYNKLVSRKIDIKCLESGDVVKSGKGVRMPVTAKHGIEKELAKKIVKLIKDSKIKVQAQIQGEQVRVTGKKRDDLQAVMQLLRDASLEQPLQFTNFRD